MDWVVGMPRHILELILEKIEAAIDFIRFGAVCGEWRCVMKDNLHERMKSLHDRYRYHQIPMLLTPAMEDNNTWNMYNVTTNKFLESKLVVPYDKRFCGSSKGWVVTVNKDWTVTLYKPCSSTALYGNNNIIQLPPLFPVEYEEGVEPYVPDVDSPVDDYEIYIDPENVYYFHICKALLTHDPVANPNECILVVIFGDVYELAFIRLSQDHAPQTWIKIEPNFFADDILFYNDLFYAVTGHGCLRSFDLRDSYVNSTIKTLARRIRWKVSSGNRYLVELNGNIVMVERFIEFEQIKIKGRTTEAFRLWRYCFDSDNWIRIESLGQMSLFVGDNSSLSVLASSFTGIQPNCIYFTQDVDRLYSISRPPRISDLGLYDLQTRQFKLHFGIDSDVLKKMNDRPPIWFVPTL